MTIEPSTLMATLLGEASESERREVAAWRADSPRNEAEYRRLARLWNIAGELEPPDATPLSVEDEVEEEFPSPVPSTSVADGSEGSEGEEEPAPPGLVRLVRGRTTRGILGLAATLIIGLGVGLWIDADGFEAPGPEVLVTGVDDVATLTLQDETVVHLAPQSRLVFSRGEDLREVSLTGRAYFAVTPDPDRPFRVRLPGGDVQVLGTRFDVESRDDGMQVTVVDGRVRMDARGARLNVRASQVARVSNGGVPEVEDVENVYEIIDWLGQFLAFESTPLEEIAVELQRRFDIRIEIADDELRQRTVTGWFADQSPRAMVSAICTVVEARCSTSNGRVRMELLDRRGDRSDGPRQVGARIDDQGPLATRTELEHRIEMKR